MAALRERRMDRAGNREHFAALLARKARRDQRSRRQRRLDDEHAARKAADQAVAAREVLLARRRARQEFGQQARRFARSRCARSRLRAGYTRSGPVPTTASVAASVAERAFVRGGVDAERQSRHDRQAGGRKRLRELARVRPALRRRVPAADDRERRTVRAARAGRCRTARAARRRCPAARADSRASSHAMT